MNLEERGEANHAAQYELGCRGKLAAQLKPPLIDIWHTPPLLDGRLLCVWVERGPRFLERRQLCA